MASPHLAPSRLTMERLDEREELILAQSTSQCCRCACFQPSINWVVAEGDNFAPGTDPHTLDSIAWIHEESSFCGRTCSNSGPGCRGAKYVHHHGPPPPAILGENQGWLQCQCGPTTSGLKEHDIQSNVVAVHEKDCSCGWACMGCLVCNCCPLPYLESRTADGRYLGKTTYVCDLCCFVPKYDVVGASGDRKYRIRPDTCVGGLCVQCRCDGTKGKCFRVPFVIRDPVTNQPLITGGNEKVSQMDVLWPGWKHMCFTQKNAYHLAFPRNCTVDDKILLMGSTILLDITMFEQKNNNDN